MHCVQGGPLNWSPMLKKDLFQRPKAAEIEFVGKMLFHLFTNMLKTNVWPRGKKCSISTARFLMTPTHPSVLDLSHDVDDYFFFMNYYSSSDFPRVLYSLL